MAVRIAGVNLNDKKRLVVALTAVYGIGLTKAEEALKANKISDDIKVKDLTSTEETALRDYIEKNIQVEGELRRDIMLRIKHQKDAGTYRGLRHTRKLPVRGQRTKTNSRTVRGNVRRTAGSGRKQSDQKT